MKLQCTFKGHGSAEFEVLPDNCHFLYEAWTFVYYIGNIHVYYATVSIWWHIEIYPKSGQNIFESWKQFEETFSNEEILEGVWFVDGMIPVPRQKGASLVLQRYVDRHSWMPPTISQAAMSLLSVIMWRPRSYIVSMKNKFWIRLTENSRKWTSYNERRE